MLYNFENSFLKNIFVFVAIVYIHVNRCNDVRNRYHDLFFIIIHVNFLSCKNSGFFRKHQQVLPDCSIVLFVCADICRSQEQNSVALEEKAQFTGNQNYDFLYKTDNVYQNRMPLVLILPQIERSYFYCIYRPLPLLQ